MTVEIDFNKWIKEISINENPDKEIIAYWFGLFETKDGFKMYLVGSKEYDENDDDWTCNNDFEPKNKYFLLPKEYSDWEKALKHTLSLINNYIISQEFKKSFFKNSKAIATGFDDGDVIRIK